jgi:hypothetical protein
MIAKRGFWLVAGAVMAACLMLGCSGPGGEKAPDAPKGPPKQETPTAKAPATADDAAPKPATPADVAAAVAQAPADACVVVAVSGMAEFEKNLKALAGPDADEMKLVEEIEKGLPAGAVDGAGPLVLMIPGGETMTPVILLRIKDAAAIQGEKAGAGIVAVKRRRPAPPGAPAGFEMPERTTYLLKREPWVAVSDNLDALKAFMRAEKHLAVSDAQRDVIGRRTLWATLNLKSLAGAAKKAIDEQQKQPAAAGAPAMPPATMKVLDWLLGLADQAQGLTFAADVLPEGIRADVEVALAEGSSLLQIAQAGLPVENFKMGLPASDRLIMAGWGRIDWTKAMPPVKALTKGLFDLFAEGESEATRKSMDALWASYEKWIGVLGDQVGMVMLPAEPGKGLYQLAETFAVTDVDQYRKLYKDQMTTSVDATKAIMTKMGAMPGMPGAPPMSMKMDMEYKEAAETIEGTPVDVMIMKMDAALAPDAPPEAKAQMKSTLDALYGPEGMVIRMAVVDTTGVVSIGGADIMARSIKAVRGQAPDLAAGPKMAEALKRLGGGGFGAGVVSLGEYVYMSMSMIARMMAAQMPKEVLDAAEKEGLRPLAAPPAGDLAALASRLDGRTLRLKVDVPKSEVVGAVSVAKQGRERMQWLMKKQQEMMQKQRPPAAPAAVPGAAPAPAPAAAPVAPAAAVPAAPAK